jgi:hypothetical protein
LFVGLVLLGVATVTAFKGHDNQPTAVADPSQLSVAAECRQALGYDARTPQERAWLQVCVHALTPPSVTPGPTDGSTSAPPVNPLTSTSTSTSTSPPTSTTTSTSAGQPPTPSSGAFPGSGNTGTPSGVALHSCATTITASGSYDGCQFNGPISVKASNVTITRSLIKGPVAAYQQSGLVIQDTTVACGCPSTSDNETPTAIMGSNFTLVRDNIYGSGHGVAVDSHVVIRDSWIHGLGGPTQAHKDGIYAGGGTDVQIIHNTIDCNDGSGGCTSAIGLLTDFSTIDHFTIQNNLLNTIGSYCFYAAGGPQKPYGSQYITFTGNHFGRSVYPKCGYYGPVTYWVSSKPGMVWSGNVWDDTGVAVPPAN